MRKIILLFIIGDITVIGILSYVFRQYTRPAAQAVVARVQPQQHTPFPNINTAELSALQIRILQLARTEYGKHPVSYDQTVLAYTDGNKEAWCADFISWVMWQADAPLSNPHSGNWRIPGVLTLQEYYQSRDRYASVTEYTPRLGDTAFFIGNNPRDRFNRQHAALVVKVEGNRLTTLGGNENGHLRLHTQELRLGEEGLAGFGKLE